MKKLFFTALVLLLLGAFLPEAISNYPGYLVVGIGGELNKGYEMNLWFAIFSLVAALIILFFVVWLARSLFR
uniref:hypothetical protein n=1 Tax=Janibacter hoylei TaxID=364298 RepID=UPI002492E109